MATKAQLQKQVNQLRVDIERAVGQLKSIFSCCSKHGVNNVHGTYADVVEALAQKLRDAEEQLVEAEDARKLLAVDRALFAKHTAALGAQIQFWVDAYEALAKEKLVKDATVEIHWRDARAKGI